MAIEERRRWKRSWEEEVEEEVKNTEVVEEWMALEPITERQWCPQERRGKRKERKWQGSGREEEVEEEEELGREGD